MKGIDRLFRARVIEWLSKEKHTEAELAEGATMVLQCNRNRALYNTIMRRPARYEEKIAYELRKHLRYLEDDMTLDEVKSVEARVLPVIGKVMDIEVSEEKPLPSPAHSSEPPYELTDTVVARGKRPDHDSLPEKIRAIWERNAERYKKIRQAHETCKTLTAACDRYEYVKAIAEAWAAYKKDFDTYDRYVAEPAGEDGGTPSPDAGEAPSPDAAESDLSVDDLKAIALARPYISKNLPVLLEMRQAATDDESRAKYEEKLSKVQERVDVLLRNGQTITDEVKAQLLEAGITLEQKDADGQGQEHPDDTPATE